MDRKLKNTIILIVILLLMVTGGSIFRFVYQSGNIEEKQKELNQLQQTSYDTAELMERLKTLKKRVVELDSILALRKYNIPMNLTQSGFYDFVNKISYDFHSQSHVNIKYEDVRKGENYSYYQYVVSGTAYFSDFFKLVYAIEQSKQLKKILNASIDNFVSVDDEGVPYYLVTYSFEVAVYFSASDRFAAKNMRENQLKPNPLYDIFYPLIRNEIPPNLEGLLDVQTAQLLAIIPEGAFVADAQGNTKLLWEGEKVYLGYLTKIDFEKNEVHFILNKGGIIEKVILNLKNEKKKSE